MVLLWSSGSVVLQCGVKMIIDIGWRDHTVNSLFPSECEGEPRPMFTTVSPHTTQCQPGCNYVISSSDLPPSRGEL